MANSNQYDSLNDAIYIRFADMLLMLDELEQSGCSRTAVCRIW
jgi:hypothetical protein